MKRITYHFQLRATNVSTAITKNTEKITMAACTLSFFNNVLNFFMHKSFLISKNSLGYSQEYGDYETIVLL
jgi:hypothetical protein